MLPPARGAAAMIAVIIPCYRVRKHVSAVLAAIGPECDAIYVVDDACPEGSGDFVEATCRDPRVRVIHHAENQGVGGATLTGFRAALADGAEILVKLDGDGQMDPAWIPRLVHPLLEGEADYAKGNRFFDLDGLHAMPRVRLVGNAVLSFASKLSSGYWNLFDPTNGFIALHAAVARALPLEKLSRRWFFESDLLFRLGTLRAVACDVPVPAVYGEEASSLVVRDVVIEFAAKHLRNTLKRIAYGYYLRSFNVASLELTLGLALLAFGVGFGTVQWVAGSLRGVASTSGTVMLAALPVIVGTQLLLAFASYDVQNVPRDPLHRRLGGGPRRPAAPRSGAQPT
jgi:glycosyltransferase involved in cell wall biosynthesis